MLTTMKNLVIVFTILYLFNSQLHQGAILLTPYKFVPMDCFYSYPTLTLTQDLVLR